MVRHASRCPRRRLACDAASAIQRTMHHPAAVTRLCGAFTIVLYIFGVTACTTRVHNTNAPLPQALDFSSAIPLPIPNNGQLRWPTADRLDNGWVIAANVFPNGWNTRIGHRSLYLVHSRTGVLPLPDGDFLFAYPLVRATPDGALHLFWAEGPASPRASGWPYRFTAVWHAVFARGRWAAPERVISGKWLHWDSLSPQAVLDDSGRFHVVVTVADTGYSGEHTYHLMRGDAGWQRQDTGIAGGYLALAILPGGRLVMVFVMGEQSSQAPNQLYTQSSGDLGRSWGPPVRVLAPADTSAAHFAKVRVVGDSIYLGWVGTESRDGTVWSLTRRRVQRDGLADTWAVPVRSPAILGALANVTFAVSGCGDITALAELLTPQMAPVVREIQLRGQSVTIRNTFVDSIEMAPLIERVGDRILRVWTGLNATKDSLQPFLREFAVCK